MKGLKMNTKDLLLEAIELLKEGNNVEATTRVETAADADVDNTFEAIADKLYSDLLLENEDVANKFKNLYAKHVAQPVTEEPQEKETVVVNNTTNEKGSSAIKWIVIGLIVILVLFFLGNVLSFDSLAV